MQVHQLGVRLLGSPSPALGISGLKLKSRKPKPRVCGVCGVDVGVSTASLRMHYKRQHPGVAVPGDEGGGGGGRRAPKGGAAGARGVVGT
ncbi:hypothetical protein FOA52_004264 [Chlamydomonas sp. UWO 241]|nr:hypothetical protein FOA52_004264 [Chlamydomonas sp. UWO 241]